MALNRSCCWREEALAIDYVDRDGAVSLRDDFRMFQAERITAAAATGASFRPRRAALLREYRARLADTNTLGAPR